MKKFLISTLAILALGIIFALLWYNQPDEYKKTEGIVEGTTYHITYEFGKYRDLDKDFEKILADFEQSVSTYIPNSVISRINANDPDVEADDYFLDVFRTSQEVYDNTHGLFDVTVAPLVNVWGFGFKPGSEVDSAGIKDILEYVGMEKVRLDGRKIIKDDPHIMFDFNAIAKGYSVDVIARFLDKKNVKNYMVEIGGELKCKGKNPKGEDWKIGIDKPVDGNNQPGTNLQAVLAVKNISLATSGNYRKFYEKNGIKYSHTINPKTGYPVISRLLSATVLASETMVADAYATSLMVMGLEEGIRFLETRNDLEAYLIYNDESGNYRVYATEGMKNYIVAQQ